MKIKTSDKSYDVMSAFVKYILPAIGTLYFTLAEIWGLPEADRILGTIVALEAFLGLILYLAKRGWVLDEEKFDGRVLVDAVEEDSDLLTLALDRPVDEIRDMKSIKLKIDKEDRYME